MQVNELEQNTSSEVTPTLRTAYFTWNLFVHRDSASGAKPMPTDLEVHRFLRLFGPRYKTGVQPIGHIARQFHIPAQAHEAPPTFL